jgi:drug/metabolite transporter (DMT)-like permease
MRYKLLLFFISIIWGLAFSAQRVGMKYCGPYEFNALRFLLGAIVVYIAGISYSGPRFFFSNKRNVIISVFLGVLLFIASSLQQVGLLHTTAGKAGFITGLYVVFVPIILFVAKRKGSVGAAIGVFLSAIGLYLLSIKEGATVILFGDFLELSSAVFWAFHILTIDYLSKRVDAFGIAFMQFAVCTVLSIAAMAMFEHVYIAEVIYNPWSILYSGVLSVGVGFTLQVVAQKRVEPVAAVVIMSLEAVFAVSGGWLLLSESLNGKEVLGCVLMFIGMLVTQINPGRATIKNK